MPTLSITKIFTFEAAHALLGYDGLCANIHGHSYVVEVFLTSDKLDNGYMVMDFCRLDKVKQFIESFDHTYSLWNREPEDFKAFIYQYNRRVAELPVSPSAEGYALLFFYAIDHILKGMPPVNGEGHVQLHSVRVHETTTGYAEAFREDLGWVDFTMKDIKFSFCQFD